MAFGLHFGKRKKPMAKVDCSINIRFSTRNKMAVHELIDATHLWEKALGKAKSQTMLFNTSDTTSSKFIGYYSPYMAERFIQYYKNLVDQDQIVLDTGGGTFSPVPTKMDIIANTFSPDKSVKDSQGDIHPQLDSTHVVESYKADKDKGYFISNDFAGMLVMLNKAIFFYNYSTASLANIQDPNAEYAKDKHLALYIRRIYLAEHHLNKLQIATIPSYKDFEQQREGSVVIPALVSPSATTRGAYTDISSNEKRKRMNMSASQSKSSEASLSPVAKSMKATSDSISRANSLSAKASDKSDDAQSASSTTSGDPATQSGSFSASAKSGQATSSSSAKSASSSNDANKILQQMKQRALNETKSVAPSSSSSVNQNSSQAKPQSSSNQQTSNANRRAQSVSAPIGNNDMNEDLIDAHQFAHKHFPRTNKPEVIRGAIQLLLDEDPNMFKPNFRFQRFNVDNKLPAPAPIQEAIRTGNLDNQRYVIQMDNQFKKIANEVIDSRSRILNMGYTRMLTDLLFGAYSKINNKVSMLLGQTMQDDDLTKSAQKYYNSHYDEHYAKLQKGRKTELDTVNDALYKEYQAKKGLRDNKINARYDKAERKLGEDINELTNEVFYEARSQRNKELYHQIDALRNNDLRDVHLQIKNYEVEFGHKFSQAGQLLFSFLDKRLQAHHEKALAVVSNLINKQVKMNEAKSNLRQAKAEMARSKNDRQLNAKWAREQRKQQSYIDSLNKQMNTYASQLTDIRASDQKTKNALNQALIKNRSLKGELDNANIILKQRKEEITKGKGNLMKYRQAKQKVQEQKSSLASQRANFNKRSNQMMSESSINSVAASEAASMSAKSELSSQAKAIAASATSYQNQVFLLQHTLQSAQAASQANAGGITSLRTELNKAHSSMNDYQASVNKASMSSSASLKNYFNQLSASSISTSQSISASASAEVASKNMAVSASNASYVSAVQSLRDTLQSAKKASQLNNGGLASLTSKLAKAKKSMTDYQSSVSQASVTRNASLNNYLSQVSANSLSASKSASVSASAKVSANNAEVSTRNDSYMSKITSLRSTLVAAQSASQTSQGSVTKLRSQLGTVQDSLNTYRLSVSVSDSIRNSSIASHNSSVADSISAHNTEYQNQMTSYQNALADASANNSDTHDVSDKIASMTASFAKYKDSVASTRTIQQSKALAQQASAAKRDSQYKANIDRLMTQLNSTSSNSGDTFSAEAELSRERASFSSYQTSVSNSNSLRYDSQASHDSLVKTSYEATIARMKSNASNASETNKRLARTRNSGDTSSANAQLVKYRKSVADIQSNFASYKSSIAESDSAEKASISASNSATSSMMSSATFGTAPTVTIDNTNHSDGVTPNTGTNFSIQHYNPNDDALEQKRLTLKKKAKKQAEIDKAKRERAKKQSKRKKRGFHLIWNK